MSATYARFDYRSHRIQGAHATIGEPVVGWGHPTTRFDIATVEFPSDWGSEHSGQGAVDDLLFVPDDKTDQH